MSPAEARNGLQSAAREPIDRELSADVKILIDFG